MWPIGTCSTGLSGYRQCHMCRLTRPCSSLTALAARDSFSASTVMQNGSAVVLRIHPAQLHHLLEGRRDLRAEPVHGVVHQVRAEAVMPGLDRRVRGEDALGLGLGQRLLEALSRRHFLPNQLQGQKGRVPFVHVEDRRLDPQGPQQAHAADAQQHLLHDPRSAVAAIDPLASGRENAARSLGGWHPANRPSPGPHSPARPGMPPRSSRSPPGTPAARPFHRAPARSAGSSG